MKKRIPLLLLALLLLTGCGRVQPQALPTDPPPGRLVQRITVTLTPDDPAFRRVYTQRETLDALMQLLREMETGDAPEQTPDLNGGQSYYTVRIQYANGRTGAYYLLGHRYFYIDGHWCWITSQHAMDFNRFLREHPTQDRTESTDEFTALLPEE